jgi:hypothetical protein
MNLKTILFIAGVIMLLGAIAYVANYQFVLVLNYTNVDYGFSIDYPVNWTAREYGLNPDEVVVFDGPQDVKVPILVTSIPDVNNMTFNDVKARLDESMNNLPDIRIIESNTTTINGKQAVQYIYYGNTMFSKLKNMEIVTWNDSDAFSLNYETDPGYFDKYLPQVKEMFESFRLLK